MTIANGYVTLYELQQHIDASGDASFAPADRANLEVAIEAASRWIDQQLDTRFYSAAETRYYTACWPDLVYVDDFVSLTTLRTDDDGNGVYETTWSATDYWLEPRAAALVGRPYRQIRRRDAGNYSFPIGVDYGVEVTGVFGYATTVPAPIKQATLLLAHRLWMRKDAVFGVIGTPGLGVTVVQAQIRADADVVALLEGVDRRVI